MSFNNSSDVLIFRDCCCYLCSAFTPHNSPDCAFDDIPHDDFLQSACRACPKFDFCVGRGGDL